MTKKPFSLLSDLLNEQSTAQSLTRDKEGLFEVRHLSLDQIKPSPRNQYGMRDLEGLAASIAALGLLHNIVVRETEEEGVYEIISGERRYRAYKMLFESGDTRFSKIPAKIETKVDDIFAEFVLLQASATAREHTDYEKSYQGVRIKQVLLELRKAGLLKELQEKGHVLKARLRDAVAAMFEVSSAQVGRWESIHTNLIPEFLHEFKGEKIGISTAYDLSTLSTEEQKAALKIYAENGQDAIRDLLVKRTTQLEESPAPSHKDDPNDEATQFVPPSTAINVQRQKHGQEPISDGHPPSPAKPLIGTDTQYQTLVGLGIEAKLNLSYAKSPADKAKYAERLEAFGMVAEEFGFGRRAYLDDVEKLLLIEGKSLVK